MTRRRGTSNAVFGWGVRGRSVAEVDLARCLPVERPLRDQCLGRDTGRSRGPLAGEPAAAGVRARPRPSGTAREQGALRNTLDNAPVMIWVTTPDGECEYRTARWYAFTGQADGEAEGLGWLDPIHPADTQHAHDEFVSANARRRPFSFEYRLRRADGAYRWCLDSAEPSLGADGQFLGYVGLVVDITDRKRTADAVAADKRVLEKMATGSPLGEVLDEIVRGIEAQSTDGVLCAISLADERGERLLHGAAPSLPSRYNLALQSIAIGPGVGSCGTAAHERRRVTVTDVSTDPLWTSYRELAAEHGLGGCSSTPIIGGDGRLLGTVAMYYTRPHEPSEHDVELLDSATRLAAIVLRQLTGRRSRGRTETGNRLSLSEHTTSAELDPWGSPLLKIGARIVPKGDGDVNQVTGFMVFGQDVPLERDPSGGHHPKPGWRRCPCHNARGWRARSPWAQNSRALRFAPMPACSLQS